MSSAVNVAADLLCRETSKTETPRNDFLAEGTWDLIRARRALVTRRLALENQARKHLRRPLSPFRTYLRTWLGV